MNLGKTNIIFFINVPSTKKKLDILRYGAMIAGFAPNLADLINITEGIWKVQFEKYLGNV